MVEADQANIVYKYKNIKLKMFKTNLNIKFNKKCLKARIIPNYINIKTNSKSKIAKLVLKKAQIIWFKLEIKELYKKKNLLNQKLYLAHLELINKINNTLVNEVICNINYNLEEQIKKIVKTKENKFKKLFKKHNDKKEKITVTHEFYPRLINLTNIEFENTEIELLEKGLSYNLPEYNKKTIDFKEIINAETTIKSIESQDLQNEIRTVINSKINKLSKEKIFKINKKSKKLNKFKKDIINIKNIKNKLNNNNALIVKADKGQTVVIIGENELMKKSYDFINENNIEKINKDPTEEYVKDINNKINKCTKIIPDNQKLALKQIKAKAPEFNALIKLQKQGMPGRPLII